METHYKVLIKSVKSDIWKEAVSPLLSFKNVEVVFAVHKEDVEREIADTDIFLGGHISREQIESAKKLRLIQFYYAGVDSLDFDYLKKRGGITVCNTHANKYAVSEVAWALLLAAAKKVLIRDRALREGVWIRGYEQKYMNVELHGKTIGVLGLGSIGGEIARVGKAFGMRVIGTKRNLKRGEECLPQVDVLYSPDKTASVCKEADYTVVAVPLTKETRGLVNGDILGNMKGKVLVNVSRGAVVDEEALYEYLKNDILGAAGIDAWYSYPGRYGDLSEHVLPSRFPFHRLENVVLSPHIAGFSVESHRINTKEAVENAVRFIRGEKLLYRVDLALGY
ncbi:MAG: hypothetical protein DRP57_08830 [Spirochaetes bacterium]|nr:MAG: hypothetical protein DRP57_08830 [Spirochaetota bacterium]